MYRFYIVNHKYGSDLLSWDKLVKYVESWWNDYSQLADMGMPSDPTKAVQMYFDFHIEYGYGEFYIEFEIKDADIKNYRDS